MGQIAFALIKGCFAVLPAGEFLFSTVQCQNKMYKDGLFSYCLACIIFHPCYFVFIYLQANQTSPGNVLTPFNLALALSVAQIHRFEETVCI